MTKVKIVDSIMGSGKTSAAIAMMNTDIDDYGDGNNYIFITPYLSEVERVKRSCTNRKFYEPQFQTINGEKYTKFDSLHSLLADCKCIASTHALFKMANDETRSLIHGGNYILILDEVMDVVEQLEIREHDIDLLFDQKLIFVDEDGFIHWNEDKRDFDTRYNDIRDMALNHTLIYYRKKILIWSFPVDVFRAFKEVYILTYNFQSQIQRYYYDLFNIDYEMYHAALENGSYIFQPGLADVSESRARFKQLINIYEGKLNNIGDEDYSLSSTWYDKRSALLLHQLRNNIGNYFKHITKSKASESMWTTYKEHRNKLKGKGYTNSFVACNARATNDYRDRFNLAYTVNRFVNPIIYAFFHDKGITIDQDTFFISELLQWLFRSAIRDDKLINLYIPSRRARTLLIKWLDGELL